MNVRLLTIVAIASALSAAGADPQLLNMVMPDAQAMAGVNVEQAKTSPFGQYVLSQMQSEDRHLQEVASLTGFDPRRDVRELLLANSGVAEQKVGLALARGTFDVAKISAAAQAKGGKVEQYRGATVISGPENRGAFAFPDGTTVVAGKPDVVKAALDRRGNTVAGISPALATKVNLLSTTEDAWAITMVPPSSLGPGQFNVPGLANPAALQMVQQASAGVKFGADVMLSAEAQTDTAQNATALAGVVQFIANLTQMHAAENPEAAALMKSLTVAAQGQTVTLALNVPQSQFEGLLKPRSKTGARRHTPRHRTE